MYCQRLLLLLLYNILSTDGQTDIRLPPSIIKGPRQSFILRSEDELITLDCKAEGVPAVTYEWKKNGYELNLNLPNIRKEAEGTITISNTTSADEGYYQCFAKNQYGTAVSVTSNLQRAVLESHTGTPNILPKTVQEGQPFHIKAELRQSFPKATFSWEMAVDTVDQNPVPLRTSKRIQIADNGDLYFAYALPQDDLDGRFYKCTAYNPYVDAKAERGYAKIAVQRASGGASQFAPTLGFASSRNTAVIFVASVTLRCFFSGNPEPNISWTGPNNTLRIERYKLGKDNSEIEIINITSSDEGEYVCSASNSRGQNQTSLRILVEAAPKFRSAADGPRNVNVTEGDSYTFNCNDGDAKPEAQVTWYQNGIPIDVNNPPRRFVFTNNKKSLTIREVCRDCGDRESHSDLTVIQCNASNIHGYAYTSGYLNVLERTAIMPPLKEEASGEMSKEREFKFDCNATSDPSTPPTVRWYKLDSDNNKVPVLEEPPDVRMVDGALIIRVAANGTEKWTKYHGVYKCIADNGYSQAEKTVEVFEPYKVPVRLPPSIIKGPRESFIFRTEDSVTLDCKAAGVPAVTYEWRKNGIQLNLNAQNIIKGADGTIVIAPATSFDQGYYQCFAKNQYGTTVSVTSHLKRALLDSSYGTPTVLPKTVQEDEPFHIEAEVRRSFPKAEFSWEMAVDAVDQNPVPLLTSKRIQIADNGDLYFAYAKAEDDLAGRIYKCTTYNPYMDVKAGGSYVNLTIQRASGNVYQFAPILGFASDTQTVAVVGGSVSLRCFFSGKPEPTIVWRGPENTLPIGRYKLNRENSEIVITNIRLSDEGEYVCSASNGRGQNQQSIHMRVEAIPIFRSAADGPRNVNVTEGDSYTFNCNADAKPEAQVTWYQNGMPLDVENPPKRFVFSNNQKSLTIQDVCQIDCDDRVSHSDLTVIQCNASNIHGYAFNSVYLNVLKRTAIMPPLNETVLSEMSKEQEFRFECIATSDPSTPPTVRWYKLYGDNKGPVSEEPPDLKIVDGALIIRVAAYGTEKWGKYLSVYKCIADNGYSQAEKIVELFGERPPTLKPQQELHLPGKFYDI